jgi:hypothetical protein
MSRPLGAIDTTSGDGHKMSVAFVEGRIFEEEQDVLLDPELQVPYGKQDALGLAVARSAPVFAETSRERLFLMVGWQLRQQERMTYSNFVAIEGFDRSGNQIHQLQTRGNKDR